jgi:hypothetical protein
MQTIAMSSYFDVLSWTRARKNREALEKTNPQNPVLNDDDEQFLQRITSQEAPAPQLPDIEPTVIDDDGVKTKADATQKEAAAIILPADAEAKEKRTWASYIPSVNNVASSIPSMPAIPSMPSLASLRSAKTDGKTDETKAEQADSMSEKVEQVAQQDETSAVKPDQQDKIDTEAKSEIVTDQDPNEAKSESTSDEVNPESKHVETEADKTDEPAQRTWASYIPAMPAISSIGRNAKVSIHNTLLSRFSTTNQYQGKEAEQTPEAKEQDEREVSVLLDRLNLSAINNRVFSFSDQSQKLYGQFTLILKDMVNGVPTAYQDMEILLKDNEKQLEGMFKSMPPFVQTLVKSLPAKFATSMGPEIMAMAGDKPGNDLKKRMEAASQASSSVSSMNLDVKKKQKRRIPGVKDLASQKGTVTSMLTNIVNFLKLRFPAFVTGTNVVMSLAVFSKSLLLVHSSVSNIHANDSYQFFSLYSGTVTNAARRCACCVRMNPQRHRQRFPKSQTLMKMRKKKKQKKKRRKKRNPK